MNQQSGFVVRAPLAEELSVLAEHEPPNSGIAASHFAAHLLGQVSFAVAWDGSKPLGYVVLDHESAAHRPELKHLFVYPQARRRGVAGSLCDWGERQARALKFSVIYLAVGLLNEPARNLYRARGFRSIGEIVQTSYEYPDSDGRLRLITEKDEFFLKSLSGPE
ncbi:ribosomal protein S18 acetylase RimI-like enzyme [Psychromicrobium silvestre]|uniref:Ribosomal protein S18 acetylase RimI-like enzyme n=1 Tax=Psychromicrobium silvestre TaxID=1645614 RepID=A0A7Y9LTN3_9MICC|nr:GNAT family N-acetyltransferase [Psychromicrobium silvestre]NYE95369.1 ribosomal protein S18 acetylase RimI-like enzyme [Psychromicrobium silvestre]